MRLLLLLTALALAPAAGAAADTGELKKQQQALQQLERRIQAIDRELESSRGRRDVLERQLEESERQIGRLQTEHRGLDEETARQEAELAKLTAERQALERGVERHRQRLAGQLRAAYRAGRGGRARLALSQGEAAGLQRLGRMLAYYEYLNRSRARAIVSARELVRQLRAAEARSREQTERLRALQARRAQARVALDTARAERLQTLEKLRRRIGAAEAELKQLRDSAGALTALVARLKEALAGLPAEFLSDRPLSERRGRLPWPVRGKLLARYGQPKAGGKLRWNGVWIAAAEGAPVRAIADGRVAYVGWMQRFGLIALVEHGGNWFSLYGHNAEVAKAAGNAVRAGEVLARAGASGGHEQSGLYFELRRGSQAVNPLEWLVRP